MRIRRGDSKTRPVFPAGAEAVGRELIGVPYLVGGRELSGMDCLGVVLWWFRALGLPVVDPLSSNPEEVWGSALPDHFCRVDSLDFGDVALFTSGQESHTGIVVFDGLIHAHGERGVICSPITGIAEFYRHRNVLQCHSSSRT